MKSYDISLPGSVCTYTPQYVEENSGFIVNAQCCNIFNKDEDNSIIAQCKGDNVETSGTNNWSRPTKHIMKSPDTQASDYGVSKCNSDTKECIVHFTMAGSSSEKYYHVAHVYDKVTDDQQSGYYLTVSVDVDGGHPHYSTGLLNCTKGSTCPN